MRIIAIPRRLGAVYYSGGSNNKLFQELVSACTASFSSTAENKTRKSSTNDVESNDRRTLIFQPTPASERPELRVEGISKADLESNAEIAAYFALNFPEEKDTAYYREIKEEESSEVQKAESFRNIRDMLCYKRTVDGSRICRHLRYHGLIPGVLYGGDPTKNIPSKSKVLVMTPHNEVHRERVRFSRAISSRLYNLTVFNSQEEKESGAEGEVVRVIPRDVQLHPVKNKVFCINYLRYHPGRPVDIPIKYINEEESAALKRGGFIVPINRHLKCLVEDGAPFPEFLALECTGAKVKEKLGLNRIILPDGVRLSKSVNKETWFHGSVFGKGISEA